MNNLKLRSTFTKLSRQDIRVQSLFGLTLVLSTIVGSSMLLVQPAIADELILAQPAAGQPLHGLSADQLERFLVGQARFVQILTFEEGLGPLFNQDSCGSCHNNPVGGTGTVSVTRAGLLINGVFDPLADMGGSLFQQEAVSEECAEVVPPEANVIAKRVTNSALAFGLIEAIPDQAFLDLVANPPNPNTPGEAHMVGAFEDPPKSPLRVGRFGWKAQVATVLTFSADAANNELGLTNRFMPDEQDPNGIFPPSVEECDTAPDDPYEDSFALGNGVDLEFIDVVTDFQRFLAPYPQTPKSGMAGEAIFMEIGCGDCHVPAFTTADDPELESFLRNKLVKPYGDFLLHDVGGLGDLIEQGAGGITEMKTPPLSGIRTRDPMMHDGRVAGFTFADRIMIAVAYHCYEDSTASDSARLFLNGITPEFCDFNPENPPCPDCPAPVKGGLDEVERSLMIDFLASLGRREFNHAIADEIDDEVTMIDFLIFASCFGGGPYTPDDLCAIDDVDQDGDVDMADFEVFLTVYSGVQTDCNDNGVLDIIDIINGTSLDLNSDGIPDECCTGDLDGNGVVGTTDLLILLANWGPNVLHPADLNGDGQVGTFDLILLLSNWGPCS